LVSAPRTRGRLLIRGAVPVVPPASAPRMRGRLLVCWSTLLKDLRQVASATQDCRAHPGDAPLLDRWVEQ